MSSWPGRREFRLGGIRGEGSLGAWGPLTRSVFLRTVLAGGLGHGDVPDLGSPGRTWDGVAIPKKFS